MTDTDGCKYGVTEYLGTGDPFFGGTADDRPLCNSGQFMRAGTYRLTDIAWFNTRAEAEAAGRKATQRKGSLVGVHRARFSAYTGLWV